MNIQLRTGVKLSEIKVDSSINVKSRPIDKEHVADLKSSMAIYGESYWQSRWNEPLKAVENGMNLTLYSGFHTYTAAMENWGEDHLVDVQVFQQDGLPDDIVSPHLLATAENAEHGRRRTNAEKRESVDRWLLNECSPTSNHYANKVIAERCNVSTTYVDNREADLAKSNVLIARPDFRFYYENGEWIQLPATPYVPEPEETEQMDEIDVDDTNEETEDDNSFTGEQETFDGITEEPVGDDTYEITNKTLLTFIPHLIDEFNVLKSCIGKLSGKTIEKSDVHEYEELEQILNLFTINVLDKFEESVTGNGEQA